LGRVARRYGQRALLVPGGLVYAASGGVLLSSLGATPHWATDLLPASLMSGIGVAMVLPHLTSAAVQGLPPDEFGAGSAVNQAIRQLGATFGVALTVALLGSVAPEDAVAVFRRVWWLLVASGLLTSLAALWLPRPVRQGHHPAGLPADADTEPAPPPRPHPTASAVPE
jgi:MFS family permease